MSVLENSLTKLFSPSTTRSAKVITNSFGGFFGGTFGGNTTVNDRSAFTLSAFYNGIEIITNDIALPSKAVYKKTDNKREPVSSNPVNYLISTRPNQYMTAFMFHKMLVQYAIVKGNGYAFIERDDYTAKPKAYQLITNKVDVVVHNAQLYYKFKYNGKNVTAKADDMIHIPGFSYNGVTGIGVVAQAAKSLGVAISAQNFSTKYYNSKGLGTGYVSTDKNLDATGKQNVSQGFTSILSNSADWKVPVLDEGMKYNPIQVTAAEAQFLQTSKHGIEEVARWLNIPPHKLKSLDGGIKSGIEGQEIMHNQDSVLPWVTKIEQEYNAKLFTEKEKHTHFVKFNLNVLMRADVKSQSEYFSKMLFNGSMSINEVRAILDLNPIPGGDTPLMPVQLQTKEQVDAKVKLLLKELNATE